MTKTNILLESGTNEVEILEFFINEPSDEGEEASPSYFGINVAKVMQVIESPNLAPIESAPHPCFLGVIPLRGHVLPVLDLGIYLGLEKLRHDYEVVIVTEFSQTVTGFLVSGVTNIHRVSWDKVVPPSGYLAQMGSNSIIGTVNMEDHFIQLLDLEHILSELDPTLAEKTWTTTAKADKQYTALVADDSATIRLLLQRNLEGANFSVTLANNGHEALNKLDEIKATAAQEGRSVSDLLDIIISDIEMPLMDGFSMTKNIKSNAETANLPVILYSSIITKELRHKGESVGADDQVSKPELDRMAQRAIELIERGAEPAQA